MKGDVIFCRIRQVAAPGRSCCIRIVVVYDEQLERKDSSVSDTERTNNDDKHEAHYSYVHVLCIVSVLLTPDIVPLLRVVML